MIHEHRWWVAAGGLCLLCVLPGYAQQQEQTRGAAFYRHVAPGQATMRVGIWGDIAAPGQYEVQVDTDLIELLFLAGGASESVLNPNVRRTSTVLISRKQGAGYVIIYEAPLDDLTTQQQTYPALQNEDVVKVETRLRQRFRWQDAISIVGGVGTVLLVADRIIRLSR